MSATETAVIIGTAALAYGLGCLNAGYYLLRWRDGRDIRQLGSGNAGARNVGRLLGRRAFALVFALDAAKGVLAVLIAWWWAPGIAAACAVIATLGHVFPAQLGFRGGKGVATAIGGGATLAVVASPLATGLATLAMVALLCVTHRHDLHRHPLRSGSRP